ncbi:hypothetical protein N7447_007133 [Penicillium robsamsonii]|uniref:uncharacterized protein n=1 Tax=Penicillium robsamsonii TaxID=1792511 RepID=UPI002548466E|nr:uncharacterized protein N7447_007133 [Penicillium robsamsonii]KAJ5824793.1 hypothetical protein N7447_007133 [Penicillium robsamsonii]
MAPSASLSEWSDGNPDFRALGHGHASQQVIIRVLLSPHIFDWVDDNTLRYQQRWPYYRYSGDLDGDEPHESEAVVEWLLNGGSKVDSRDSLGRTVPHQAAFQTCEDTITLLLERGTDPMSKDLFGQIPLHMACAPFSCYAEDAFEILLEAGSDPNSRDIEGETPLHQSARAGFYWAPPVYLAVISGRGEDSERMLKALCKAGADCSMVNNDGQTAMDLARGWDEEETMIASSDELTEESDEDEYEDSQQNKSGESNSESEDDPE